MRRVAQRVAVLDASHQLAVAVGLGPLPASAPIGYVPVPVRLVDRCHRTGGVDDRQAESPRPPDEPVVPTGAPDREGRHFPPDSLREREPVELVVGSRSAVLLAPAAEQEEARPTKAPHGDREVRVEQDIRVRIHQHGGPGQLRCTRERIRDERRPELGALDLRLVARPRLARGVGGSLLVAEDEHAGAKPSPRRKGAPLLAVGLADEGLGDREDGEHGVRETSRMVVVASKYGQLGNRLFVFANLVAAAEEHGFVVWNPSFDEYAPLFPATARDPLCAYPVRRTRLPAGLRGPAFGLARRLAGLAMRVPPLRRAFPVIRLRGDEELDLSDEPFVRLARERIVLVQGWLFRDPASLERHADAVRTHFRPFEDDARAAEAALAAARTGVDEVVGLHVRRGDYRTFEDGRYFWEDDVYAGLARRVVDLLGDRRVRVVVCSDEPVSQQRFPGVDVAPGPGEPIRDLLTLAGCDRIVGPPSTFTAWASYYGNVPLLAVEDPAEPLALDGFAVVGA